MTPLDFLRAIWPDHGLYAIALPLKGGAMLHKVFDTIEAAAAFADSVKDRTDVYFATHALKARTVWDPRKPNPRGGEPGGHRVRTQANMRACQVFFFDIDCGEAKAGEGKGYATQPEAVAALIAFCAETKLPLPMTVSSGRGVHAYWRLKAEIASEDWRRSAQKLYDLAVAKGLKVDPARTSDSASILRVAGTRNLKGAPLLVEVKGNGAGRRDNSEFLGALNAAADACGIPTRLLRAPIADTGFGGSTALPFDGPQVTMKELLTACPQVRAIAAVKGAVSEPAWYQFINAVRHVENGRTWAQRFSTGDIRYSVEATDAKLDQLESKVSGPPSCATLRDKCGAAPCDACYWWGKKVSGPLDAARKPQPVDLAPAPVAAPVVQPAADDAPLLLDSFVPRCEPPFPYKAVMGGGVLFEKEVDDKITPVKILNCDLHPRFRQVDAQARTDQHEWCVKNPLEDWKTFTISSGLVHDARGLAQALADNGILFTFRNLKYVQDYMSLYLQDLQRKAKAESQFGNLGWADGRTKFVLHDRILNRDGSVAPVFLRPSAKEVLIDRHGMGRKGTLAGQLAALRFYDKPQYVARQFLILASLAAPLYHIFGYAGSIIHCNGETGAAKSMALSAAASLWGHPTKLPLDGRKQGGTANFRDELTATMANLPVCIDEIREIAEDYALEFALGVTQAHSRKGRLRHDGSMRPSVGGDKSTLVLTTGNISLHGVLSNKNIAGEAGAMRIFEMPFEVFDDDAAGAEQFMYALAENYGQIGAPWMRFVIQNYDRVVDAFHAKRNEFNKLAKWRPTERFWSAICAAVLATADLAREQGLLPFASAEIADWLQHIQIPLMRGGLKDQYPSAVEVLTDYINMINENMVAVPVGNTSILREPKGDVKARYESDSKRLWLSRDPFKAFCDRRHAPYQQYMRELSLSRVVINRNDRKTLTTGTNLLTGRSWCFVVNMGHDEMKDLSPALEPLQRGRGPLLTSVKGERA